MPYAKQNVTDLLNAWGAGDKEAFDELVALVYEELRRQASRYLRREAPGQTLQTTDLIHEAFLRLVDQRNPHWQNRAQFFGINDIPPMKHPVFCFIASSCEKER